MLLLADRISTDGVRIADSLNHTRNIRHSSWITLQIAQLLPAMERFIPEFNLARGAM